MPEQLTKWFLEHGAVGILAIGLTFGLRMIWKKYEELQVRYDKLQELRVSERDNIVKALVENTRTLSGVAEAISARRR